jgi:predicted MPP superfamily phosphohydrolase
LGRDDLLEFRYTLANAETEERIAKMKKTLVGILLAFHMVVFSFFAVAQGAPAPNAGASSFTESVTEAEGTGIVSGPAEQWKVMPMKTLSGGAAISSVTPGAALEFNFSGAAISADVVVGSNSGEMSVAVDGKIVGTIDLFRNHMSPSSERIALADKLGPGEHKLRIVVLAVHNPKRRGTLVAVDTLRVANTSYGSISGVLECHYNEGLPVARARVSAIGKDGETEITTDFSGKFVFSALAPGTYTLHFEHPGYITEEQAGLTVSSGQALSLNKVLFEEKIGARPLTYIRNPLGVRPVIVRPGDAFPIEVVAPSTTSGWQAALETEWANSTLELKNASFNSANGRWTVTVAVPSGVPSLLFGLRLKFSGGEDFQPRAVMVVPAFKDSIRVVHLTDVHVYKSEILFPRYQQLADEINLINPDVVVVTGDLTDSNGYTDERWPESDQYPPMLDLWNAYNIPTYIVAGNHDLSPRKNDDDYLRWMRFFDTTDYSFDVGPYHFTAFDDAATMSSGSRTPFAEDVSPDQLEWIDKDLARKSGAKMRILLFHVPLHDTKSKVKELASRHDVKLALYGHVHVNQVNKIPPTTYVQTGAAYEGSYRVVNLDNGIVGEINAKQDGFSAFSIGTLRSNVQKSDDGRSLTLKVRNASTRAFAGASWRAEMPTSADYSCAGCTIVSRIISGGKTLVVFTFDVPAKKEITTILTAK